MRETYPKCPIRELVGFPSVQGNWLESPGWLYFRENEGENTTAGNKRTLR
jgi:hypothetical protein